MDRQKLIMIFGGAALAAALLTWILYRSTVAPKGEKLVKVYAAAGNYSAGTRLTKDRIKQVSIVEKNVPVGAIVEEKQILDRVSMYPLSANETFIATRLSGPGSPEGFAAMIEPGKRAVSVPVTDATGAGGMIQPRSHVDVIFTKSGSLAEAVSTTIVEDVVVLAIGRLTEIPATPVTTDKASSTAPTTTAISTAASTQQKAAVLLVSPEESRKLELARNQGKISLALRNPQDKARAAEIESVTAENLDPNIYARLALSKQRGGRSRLPGSANLKNDEEWCKLVGCESKPKPVVAPVKPPKPEPPKPRAVVDVFHGDKHVQEAFHD